ncbi:MAG: alanine/ornithine racemase family PLP-dependent enzyme [Bacteroidetes bacterium]|nr:alanine/ornithine racemase family PLP-dependent enzyme [Bacteroidota bacterium]
MAYIELHKGKLRENYHFLDRLFRQHHIEWGVVTKLLCGNRSYLQVLFELGVREIFDSRISNLKSVKRLNPEIQTVYIKPPPKRSIQSLVRYADISFNTEFYTIKMISEEACRQDKIHRIIIMIEMGDLREGVMGDRLMEFYSKVFELPNIEIIGIGANLNCLNGVIPTHDKLIQLSLYKQLIEATFRKKIPWVTGGSSVTIPLLQKQLVPKGINHFRVGETLFLGNNLLTGKTLKGMKSDIFTLYAEIIELIEKPKVPIGEITTNVAGETPEIVEEDYGKTSYRAILDIGLLDVSPDHLVLKDNRIAVSGASSDMIVVDLGENKPGYKVGDVIGFGLSYMGVLSILNSNYIEKVVI